MYYYQFQKESTNKTNMQNLNHRKQLKHNLFCFKTPLKMRKTNEEKQIYT